MAGANVSPNTIGGRFTNVAPFLPQPVVTSQNGGGSLRQVSPDREVLLIRIRCLSTTGQRP